MKKPTLLIALLLLVVTISACATEGTSSPVEGAITIPNSLGFGSDEDGALVQFLRVEHDSRCAAGVQCVRAGEAFVRLAITVDGERVESEWRMEPQTPATFDLGRFTISLLELRPDPPPASGVQQSEYELLLRIEER